MPSTSPRSQRPLWLNLLGLVALLLFAVGAYLGLVVSPPDQNQGDLFRITYAHVSVVWIGFVAVIISAVFGMLYLWRSKPSDDAWALASAEASLLYFGLAIVGGMTYSKPTLGVFWDWDAKLTLTALAFALLVGYFIVRGLIDDPQQRGRVSAIVSIIVFVSLPFNWMAAKWFRTLHPAKSIEVSAEGVSSTMSPIFANILLFNVAVAALIFIFFLFERVRIIRLEQAGQDLEPEPSSKREVIRV